MLDITAPKFIYWNIQGFLKSHAAVSENSGFSELIRKNHVQKNSEGEYTHLSPSPGLIAKPSTAGQKMTRMFQSWTIQMMDHIRHYSYD
jgi:hypothetical protein